jgi:uncharacterized membrane protein (DUF106 family)
MKGMYMMVLLMVISFGIAGLWSNISIIKDSVHAVLDPTAGTLLLWNPTMGMILITGIVVLISTLLQKYMTDQDLLKQIKEEQKLVQQEMKLYREHPEKTMELSKKSMELTMKAMPITMKPVLYTIVPFILLIRWFGDHFIAHPEKILGFMSGVWGYIVLSVIWSIILRKVLKVH